MEDGPCILPKGKKRRTQPVKLSEQATYFMERVSRSDEQAFEQFRKYYVSRVTALIRKRHKNSADIDDLTQEVFSQVWKKREGAFPYCRYQAATLSLNVSDCSCNVCHRPAL